MFQQPRIGAGKLWLLSDDGAVHMDGAACKDLKPQHRRFRALAFGLAALTSLGNKAVFRVR